MTKTKRAFLLGLAVGAPMGQVVGVVAYRLGIDTYTFLMGLALVVLIGTYYFEEYLKNET